MPRRSIPDPIAAKLGARIRQLRKERGMSLVELADAAGLSRGHMSSIERGLVLMNVVTLVVTARALAVPPFVLAMFPNEDPLSAAIEHVRSMEGGDTRKAAGKLRQTVFGELAKKRQKR